MRNSCECKLFLVHLKFLLPTCTLWLWMWMSAYDVWSEMVCMCNDFTAIWIWDRNPAAATRVSHNIKLQRKPTNRQKVLKPLYLITFSGEVVNSLIYPFATCIHSIDELKRNVLACSLTSQRFQPGGSAVDACSRTQGEKLMNCWWVEKI